MAFPIFSLLYHVESPLLSDAALLSPDEGPIQELEFRDAHSFDVNQFLTSPPLGTPYDTTYDDFTASPNDSPYNEFLTTPLIQDDSDPVIFGGPGDSGSLALFPEMSLLDRRGHVETKQEPVVPKMPDMDNMYTISPGTPLLDSVDTSSPTMPSTMSFTPVPSGQCRRKSSATGTRKNITPESLIPIDAPTQSRKYLLPSATSRKEIPATFARKRNRAQAFADEEDELDEHEALAPNATEKERIEWKRRQNTLAARKSRKRKLEHQLYLETRVGTLEQELEMWKTRAKTLQSTLRNHGIPVADFPEDQ